MTPYTKASPVYTQITSKDHQVHMRSKMSFKTDKMEFWNRHVPNLYLNQLRKDVHLLKDAEAKIFKQTNISLDLMKRSPTYIGSHVSGSWILIAACVGLSILTVLLSVCYCQVRRQVKTLIRQSSVSSGQPILQWWAAVLAVVDPFYSGGQLVHLFRTKHRILYTMAFVQI